MGLGGIWLACLADGISRSAVDCLAAKPREDCEPLAKKSPFWETPTYRSPKSTFCLKREVSAGAW